MTAPTVISDPRLQEAFNVVLDLVGNGDFSDVELVYAAEQAFILALNERLQAAEKMAEFCDAMSHWESASKALAAYRSAQRLSVS